MTANSEPKQRGGFQPGQSGNPAGKPKGARNKTTLAVEALLDGEAEALTRKAIERALEGDSVALRLCLERIPSRPARAAHALRYAASGGGRQRPQSNGRGRGRCCGGRTDAGRGRDDRETGRGFRRH